MTPIDAAALVLLLFLPLNWLVLRYFDRLDDPRYLRRQGVVVLLGKALEAHSEPIGEFMGQPIWGTVQFKGLVYGFDRIQAAARRDELGAGELFLAPGLVYVLRIVD